MAAAVRVPVHLKGWEASEHLVNQHAHTPAVYLNVVGFAHGDLWGHVLHCAAVGCPLGLGDDGPPKIRYLQSVPRNNHIFGLQIAVDHPIDVQVAEPLHDLVGVAGCLLLAQEAFSFYL